MRRCFSLGLPTLLLGAAAEAALARFAPKDAACRCEIATVPLFALRAV